MKIDKWVELEREMAHRGFTFADPDQTIVHSDIKIEFQCQNAEHPPLVMNAWRFRNGSVCPHCKAELVVANLQRKQREKPTN